MIAALVIVGIGLVLGLAIFNIRDQWRRGGRPWCKAGPYIKPEILHDLSLKGKILGSGIYLGLTILLGGIGYWTGNPYYLAFGLLWVGTGLGFVLTAIWFAKRRGTLAWIWTKEVV